MPTRPEALLLSSCSHVVRRFRSVIDQETTCKLINHAPETLFVSAEAQ